MSFFYQTSAAAARSRRKKERDGQPRTNNTSAGGRRHRSSSKTQDSRSPPSKSPTLQASIYTQQTIALDQLPPLPPSETTTPAFSSPSFSIHEPQLSRSGTFQLTQQPFTPIALQQYLDQEDDDQDDDDEYEGIAWSNARSTSTKIDDGQPQGIDIKASADPRDTSRSSATEYLSSNNHTTQAYPDEGSIYFDADSGGSKFGKVNSSTVSYQKPHNQPNQLANSNWSKGEINLPNTIGSMEEFYKKSPNFHVEGLSHAKVSTRRRPFSQEVSIVDMRDLSQESTDIQHAIIRSPSQQSAPLLSRAFTPPALPLGAGRGPLSTPPVFVSPIPLRSHIPGDYYGIFNTSPSHHTQSLLRGPNLGYTGSSQSHSGLQPNTIASVPYTATLPGPTVSELRKTEFNDEKREDPALVLHKLQSVLPQIQMLISRSQYFGTRDPASEYDPAHVLTLKKLQEQTSRVQQLEMRLTEKETKHRQEIDNLGVSIIELQIQSKHFQSDAICQKASRDILHEELIELRIASDLSVKALDNEKRNLQHQIENIKMTSQKEVEDKTDCLRTDVEAKNTLINTLQTQFGILQASHAMEQESSRNLHEQKYQQQLNEHKWTVQDLDRQLQNELGKSADLEMDLEKLQHKMQYELGRRDEELEIKRTKIIVNYENQIAALSLDSSNERKEQERLRDENARLDKELDNMRLELRCDKARFDQVTQDFRVAAAKMHQENVRFKS